MARLFYVSGDFELAKRTLRLYTQVVGKAWQTANAESPQSHDEGNSEIENGDNNVDTDENWVETLVQGSRMLCRLSCTKSGTVLGSTGNGMEEAKEAGQLLQKAKTRLDVSDAALVASLDLAEGIWNAVMAYKGAPSDSQPFHFAHLIYRTGFSHSSTQAFRISPLVQKIRGYQSYCIRVLPSCSCIGSRWPRT